MAESVPDCSGRPGSVLSSGNSLYAVSHEPPWVSFWFSSLLPCSKAHAGMWIGCGTKLPMVMNLLSGW